MVLSTNFYKIAKSILKRRTIPLIEKEQTNLITRILNRIFYLNLFALLFVAIMLSTMVLYILIGVLSMAKII